MPPSFWRRLVTFALEIVGAVILEALLSDRHRSNSSRRRSSS